VSGNRTPLTGRPLEQPDPAPLRVNAVWNSGQPCTEHQVAYSGGVPCTGALRCTLCLCLWEPGTGAFLAYWPPPAFRLDHALGESWPGQGGGRAGRRR
jgi:hypothetical protein